MKLKLQAQMQYNNLYKTHGMTLFQLLRVKAVNVSIKIKVIENEGK